MKTVVIATNNKNKVREFKSILDNPNLEFKTLKEIGYDKEIEENGNTFEEIPEDPNDLISNFLQTGGKRVHRSLITLRWGMNRAILQSIRYRQYSV